MILVLTPSHWSIPTLCYSSPFMLGLIGWAVYVPDSFAFLIVMVAFFSPVSASSQDTPATSLLNRRSFSRVLWRFSWGGGEFTLISRWLLFAPRPWIICMILLVLYSYLSYCKHAVHVTDRFSTQNMKAGMLLITFDFRSWMDQAVWSTDIRAARRETHRFSTQNWDHTFFKWKCQNDSSVIFLALIHHF